MGSLAYWPSAEYFAPHHDGGTTNPDTCFQSLILKLQSYWASKGCVILQPYDMEVGAGTFHWATTLRALGPKPWRAAYVQASRRPKDGRYGENPNRLQHYYQFQVILKPSPAESQELYLGSLQAIGIDPLLHDIRFVEDDWESPTLGAWGLGWEVWLDGMEVSQFTYFQQVGGLECNPVSTELTYGLERLAMYVQGVESIFDLDYNGAGMSYRDVYMQAEQEYSAFNFEAANTDLLFKHFADAEAECGALLNRNNPLALPAYDQCLKASHLFNLLDARGVISVTERQAYIGRVRALAKGCCEAWEATQKEPAHGWLLLELFSEEIPARMQARAAEDLQRLVTEKLKSAGLLYTSARSFVTPRRLALVVDGLPTHSADEKKEEKGPKVGSPQQAVDGFLKKYGLTSLDQCEQRDTGKGVFYFAVIEKKGSTTDAALPQIIVESIQAMPWAKSMRFAAQTFRWVRPFHSVIALFDGKVLQGALTTGEGTTIRFGDGTYGHRFLAPAKMSVANFPDYKAKLHAAKVILDQAERRALIAKASAEAAAKLGLTVKPDEALLDEVTGLVEWPVVLTGKIDAEFMSVPAEVLTTTMRVNQKYFALNDTSGKLAPHFLLVSNLEAKDGGKAIVAGNERVLRARLSDAKFFWEQDQKAKLADRLPALDGITYHAKLGSVGQKVKRIRALAAMLSEKIAGGDAGLADKAANLAKADLVSGMVGEFPELQGIMGRYYAKLEGLPDAVADAIADHYKPLGPNDACPKAPVSVAVALADKLDSLVGFFAVDERPTGSKDPFALRRAALGVIRLILENRLRLNLRDVIAFAYSGYYDNGGSFEKNQPKAVIALLMDFFADRLKVALKEQGVRHDLITAVFALGDEDDLTRLLARVDALKGFVESADGTNLLAAHKRANSIVRIEEKKDNAAYNGGIDGAVLAQDEEKALFTAIEKARSQSKTALESEAYGTVMASLAALRQPVDAFFEKVTVNAEDPKLRANRLRMLSAINATLSSVADFSKIEG